MTKSFLFFFLIPLFSFAQLKTGTWRGVLLLKEEPLHFNFELLKEKNNYVIIIKNATEKIRVEEIKIKGDSLFVRMPIFDSMFKLKIENNQLRGFWINYSRKKDNILAFTAEYGKVSRKVEDEIATTNFSGKWEVDFSKGTEDSTKAIAVIGQKGNYLEGTFLTPTGDYRFLEGIVIGRNFTLSCFDGSHAFLFKGTLSDKGTIDGTFFSGLHWKEPWTGKRNEKFELPNPDSLTFLNPGFSKLEFSFPDLEGKKVSLADEKYKNKVVVVQIMGTWCPNCMDETIFLSDLYNKKGIKNIEVVGLAFEKFPDKAKGNLIRLRERLNIKYDLLIAGSSDKKEAAKALPALNHIMSFPTTIFIDKKGFVRKIHTGFSGPATGAHYDKFRDEFNLFVEKLLKE